MAKNDISPAEQAKLDIANRPRQSVVRFVELYNIVSTAAPEKLDELFGDQVTALEAVAEKVKNPVEVAIEKATANQVDIAVKALTNDDPQNGYAGYVFDGELFAEKTRVKTPRKAATPVQKIEAVLDSVNDEDLAALQELLKARGLA